MFCGFFFSCLSFLTVDKHRRLVDTIDNDIVSSSMCANIHYLEGKVTLGDKCGMC